MKGFHGARLAVIEEKLVGVNATAGIPVFINTWLLTYRILQGKELLR